MQHPMPSHPRHLAGQRVRLVISHGTAFELLFENGSCLMVYSYAYLEHGCSEVKKVSPDVNAAREPEGRDYVTCPGCGAIVFERMPGTPCPGCGRALPAAKRPSAKGNEPEDLNDEPIALPFVDF